MSLHRRMPRRRGAQTACLDQGSLWDVEDAVRTGGRCGVEWRGDFNELCGCSLDGRENLRNEERRAGTADTPEARILALIARGSVRRLSACVWCNEREDLCGLDGEQGEPYRQEDAGHGRTISRLPRCTSMDRISEFAGSVNTETTAPRRTV